MDSKSEIKPLSEQERKGRSRVSEDIYKTAHDGRFKEVSSLRKQLIEAAELGVISKNDLDEAAFPSRPEEDKETQVEISEEAEKIPQK